MLATEYGMFAANPMGTSFDQSSTGAGAPAVVGWSANQQRVPPAVSTLRRSQQPSIGSPRSVVLVAFTAQRCDNIGIFDQYPAIIIVYYATNAAHKYNYIE